MSDLPTGTVTFLFTDIEGSTRLAQAHPDGWEVARRRHHALLRAACEAHGGHVFQIIGDAFCVAFAIAPDAAAAAIASQRELQVISAGQPAVAIRVRMGIHTGSAEWRDGDYVGYLTLAHVQRILSLAHGGQILTSNATAALLANQLPDGVALRDLGEHRLKGLLHPERLWQINATDLPHDFPPLDSLNTIPNNLPVQVTSFIGRERELAELRRLLTTTRLLTLTGSGGVGKTRLSLQLAEEVLPNFADGAWLVELGSVADPELVPQAVASALGLREQSGQSLLATLTNHLHDKQLLLIMDNCEHLIEASARLGDAVLHAAPALKILASSREGLGIAGEATYHVPSLPVPNLKGDMSAANLETFDAVRLFLERASAAKAAYILTSTNAHAIAQICHRLDGIPLAIELAAVRIKVFSAEQIAQRLDDRFRLLTGGSRTALPRQQTLRNTIDWSFSLLSNLERVLLRRVSIFTGGWTFEAAESVCADVDAGRSDMSNTLDNALTENILDQPSAPFAAQQTAFILSPSDILDLLSHLVEKSLVLTDEQDGETRYRMLETIRRYALDKLIEAAEVESMRLRHATYYYQLAATTFKTGQWRGQGFQIANRALREHDNWRAALDWCFGGDHAELGVELATLLANFWYSFGLLKEGRAWLGRALSQEMKQKAVHASVLRGIGMIESRQGDFHAAATHTEQAAAIWRELGDTLGLADALHYVGHAIFDERNYELARTYFEQSRALYESLGDSTNSVTLFADVGLVAYHLGDYAEAERRFRHALGEYRRLGKMDSVGLMLLRLGDLARIAGNDQHAREQYEESLRLHRGLRANLELASSLHKLGQLARQRGERESAHSYLTESMALQGEAGNKQGIAECLAAFGSLAIQESDSMRAVALFGAAEALLERIGAPLAPADRIDFDLDVGRLRGQLRESVFSAAWAEGRALTLEQAVTLALQTSVSSLQTDAEIPAALSVASGLTAREHDVLRLLAQGLSNEEIAERLVISAFTVRAHLRAIYSKLGVTTRSAATRYALEHHLA